VKRPPRSRRHARRAQRVFLDANVLYSAAYLEGSRLEQLWRLERVELISSGYAVEEVKRNLIRDRPEAVARLNALLRKVRRVPEPASDSLAPLMSLDAKDQPILLAAIEAGADSLLTGDRRHFGHLYGKSVRDVLILPPADFLATRRRFKG